MPAGAPITTQTPGEFVISVVIAENSIASIAPGNAFTNDQTTFGNGWAHLTSNSAAPAIYQARWTQNTSGRSCSSSATFRIGQ